MEKETVCEVEKKKNKQNKKKKKFEKIDWRKLEMKTQSARQVQLLLAIHESKTSKFWKIERFAKL